MKCKIVVLVLIILVFCACKLNSAQSDNAYVNISNVNTEKKFKGYIKQRPLAKIYSKTEGKISFLPYSKGDYIRKGEVIVRLDNILYKINKEKFKLQQGLNYNIITAPFDGYVEEIYKPLNSYVKSKEAIIAIYPNNKTEAETMVEAKYINKINLNKEVKIEYKDSVYEAKISNISKNSDNYIIELEFDNLYKELKEGASINVKLDME